MMTQTRQTKAASIERVIHVERTDALRATVTETKVLKTKTTSSSRMYRISRISTAFGVAAATVTNLTSGECYDVLLDGHRSTCTCPGHSYGPNNKPCVHLEVCSEALKRNLL